MGGLIFVPVFFGSGLLILIRVALGLSVIPHLILLGIIFSLGAAKAWIRWRAVRLALANYGNEAHRGWLAHVSLWPFTTALFLYNGVAAYFSQRIDWRGISYELKSPTEAVIISRET